MKVRGRRGRQTTGPKKRKNNNKSGCEKKSEKCDFRDLFGSGSAALFGPVGGRGVDGIIRRVQKRPASERCGGFTGLRPAADPFLKDAVRWFRRCRLSVGVVYVGGVRWSRRCRLSVGVRWFRRCRLSVGIVYEGGVYWFRWTTDFGSRRGPPTMG